MEARARTLACTVHSRALQPRERCLLELAREVACQVQVDLRLESLCREPTVRSVGLAYHDDGLAQLPCRRQLEHALGRADVPGGEENQKSLGLFHMCLDLVVLFHAVPIKIHFARREDR